ncbi:MAG: hypothetical protein JXR40_10020 [Pontiellaceae bacterium]|nr:hypothetical protein [Pontiellaceae bacterium]
MSTRQHGTVPMFKMRPSVGPLIGAAVIFLFGMGVHQFAAQDPTMVDFQQTSKLILALCIGLSGILVIIATGRMWFKHLWHDRYKHKR